ncbi:NucA/NucB deoxyribonuclease domain-containing protein [Streptomyces sp. NPDC048717]|uniref:NucA/NucB deoxyribonuclease domain-containing protein n=1 Tax=Streptomyces sp. NPDC048717 TaxID=3154928 RepID=UPI003449C8C3
MKSTLGRAPLVALAGALVATGLSVGPSPAAVPSASEGLRSAIAFGPAASSARARTTSYTRTRGTSSEPFVLTVTDTRGKIRGRMGGTATQSETLNSKSHDWTRTLEIKIVSASGLAAGGASITTKLTCGKGALRCQPSKAVKGTLRKGKVYTASWTVHSPGDKVVVHRPVPVAAISVIGATPARSTPMTLRGVRCDSVSYLGRPGCVYASWLPTFALSRTDRAIREAAQHVYDAQRRIKGQPGLSTPLHRLTNKSRIGKNRAAVCKKKYPRPKGRSCDEYPMASTREGGKDEARGLSSHRMINAKQNSKAGTRLNQFYGNNRIMDGDGFFAKAT